MPKSPNAYNVSLFADRDMVAGEVLWSHVVPENIILLSGADRSTGTVSGVPVEDVIIDILIDDIEFGLLVFRTDSGTGVFHLPDNKVILSGSIIEFRMRNGGGPMAGLTVNLIGLYR